ncbi:MAG: glycosyltransferase family 2 protein [Terriglobales bacterium]|jgi:GT2 family glycosyltransferase
MGLSGQASQSEAAAPEVSIVIPARNEEASLGECLQSLVAQTGVAFEIIVVDDGSTDRTREIAERFSGVQVISPGPFPAGWTGKNNAVIAGAGAARAEWLLFTDADTVHLPGSLARALAEAKREAVDMLSYSPQQVVESFAEKIVMPIVFAELAAEYPPAKVRDQSSGIVAANGQYILVRRAAYDSIGGHTAVAGEILEDVALAKTFRRAGLRIYFRYGGDAVCARMYRNWEQLREGWTKNLALLFPHARRRAFLLAVGWLLAWLTLPLLVPVIALYVRLRRANFGMGATVLSTALGPPVFAYLLLRSQRAHAGGSVSWKGRAYSGMAGDTEGFNHPRPPAQASPIESRR